MSMTLPAHVDAVTSDLERLAASITQLSGSPELADELDHETVSRLKTTLDEFRTILWPVLLAFEQTHGANASDALREYRMRRIREMMAPLLEEHRKHPQPAIALFFAEVKRITST